MIGVYDSGAGGLSIWKELVALMPDEDYVYVGDNAYCPYGDKPVELLVRRGEAITEFLLSKGAELIVVACNTATAAAISHLRQKYDSIPFVGIEPAVKPAAITTKTGVVGVLATANTLKAEKYHTTLERFAVGVKVVEQVGVGLVNAVEDGTDATEALKKCLAPMLEAGADTLVLGCTHYPFLTDQIQAITGPEIHIVNPAPAVATRTKSLLPAHTRNLRPSGSSAFYTTGSSDAVRRLSLLIKPDLPAGSWHCYEKIEG